MELFRRIAELRMEGYNNEEIALIIDSASVSDINIAQKKAESWWNLARETSVDVICVLVLLRG